MVGLSNLIMGLRGCYSARVAETYLCHHMLLKFCEARTLCDKTYLQTKSFSGSLYSQWQGASR